MNQEPMTLDEFFAEARRLNCRMVSDDPAEVRAALDAKDAEIAALQSLCRRARVQLRKWSEWYGVEDHVARGQLALPPAGDVELSEDITEALEPKKPSPKPQADPPAA